MIRSLAALSFLLLAGAQAPDPPPPGAAASGPSDQEIVVRARTEEEVERFVQALTQSHGGRQLARWNNHICAKVLGLEPGQAAFIAGRIGEVARGLRIPVAPGRCRGNIVIVVAGNADEFTRILVQRHPRLFRGLHDNLASRSEIARLLEPRPIRWFAASATGNEAGRPIADGVNRVYSFSRLRSSTRENATLSFIIVDAAGLHDIIWSQLADYLALVALATPAMDADYDESTVLSIFRMRDRGGRGPAHLTGRDRAFLRALYTTQAATSAQRQRLAIRARLRRSETEMVDD